MLGNERLAIYSHFLVLLLHVSTQKYRYNGCSLYCLIFSGMTNKSKTSHQSVSLLYISPSFLEKLSNIEDIKIRIYKKVRTIQGSKNGGPFKPGTQFNRLTYNTNSDICSVGLLQNRLIDLLSTIQLLLSIGWKNWTFRDFL